MILRPWGKVVQTLDIVVRDPGARGERRDHQHHGALPRVAAAPSVAHALWLPANRLHSTRLSLIRCHRVRLTIAYVRCRTIAGSRPRGRSNDDATAILERIARVHDDSLAGCESLRHDGTRGVSGPKPDDAKVCLV